MRPNLMSPRRPTTSGEDSILAMLEREPARKRKGGASSGRLAWYGASAMLAVLLTGALVWMAANNDGLRPDVQESVLADAGKPLPQAAPAPETGVALIQVAMAPAAPPEPRSAAVIVDQPPPAEAVPPLRLLKPAPGKAAPPVRVPVPDATPPRPVARTAPPPRPVAVAPAEPKPAARPAAPPARAKPALVAKNAARPAPSKAQRGAAPARSGEAGVDADVALISAVIVHANGHAPEGSQMTELLCPNDNCKARPPRE